MCKCRILHFRAFLSPALNVTTGACNGFTLTVLPETSPPQDSSGELSGSWNISVGFLVFFFFNMEIAMHLKKASLHRQAQHRSNTNFPVVQQSNTFCLNKALPHRRAHPPTSKHAAGLSIQMRKKLCPEGTE